MHSSEPIATGESLTATGHAEAAGPRAMAEPLAAGAHDGTSPAAVRAATAAMSQLSTQPDTQQPLQQQSAPPAAAPFSTPQPLQPRQQQPGGILGLQPGTPRTQSLTPMRSSAGSGEEVVCGQRIPSSGATPFGLLPSAPQAGDSRWVGRLWLGSAAGSGMGGEVEEAEGDAVRDTAMGESAEAARAVHAVQAAPQPSPLLPSQQQQQQPVQPPSDHVMGEGTAAGGGSQDSLNLPLASACVPHAQVVAFVWSVLRHIVPAPLLGSKCSRRRVLGGLPCPWGRVIAGIGGVLALAVIACCRCLVHACWAVRLV